MTTTTNETLQFIVLRLCVIQLITNFKLTIFKQKKIQQKTKLSNNFKHISMNELLSSLWFVILFFLWKFVFFSLKLKKLSTWNPIKRHIFEFGAKSLKLFYQTDQLNKVNLFSVQKWIKTANIETIFKKSFSTQKNYLFTWFIFYE